MRWVTRPNCHVDRAACAWLIKRHLDPEPEFVFVEDAELIPEGAIGFDMRGVEFSHRDGGCSFETMLRHYEIDDPVLWDIARAVHEADLHDERYDSPEAAGLDALMRGMSMLHDDEMFLELAAKVYDGFYAYCKKIRDLENSVR